MSEEKKQPASDHDGSGRKGTGRWTRNQKPVHGKEKRESKYSGLLVQEAFRKKPGLTWGGGNIQPLTKNERQSSLSRNHLSSKEPKSSIGEGKSGILLGRKRHRTPGKSRKEEPTGEYFSSGKKYYRSPQQRVSRRKNVHVRRGKNRSFKREGHTLPGERNH